MAEKKQESASITLEEAQKMLAEAQAAKEEARALLEEARAAMTAAQETRGEATEPGEEDEAAKQHRQYLEDLEAGRKYMEEKISMRLFKDNDKYKGDVLVCVNGDRLLIKRGETVEIPRKFALVLEESMRQDADTANLIESMSAEYEAEAKARNIS